MISGPCFLLPKPQDILMLHHKPERPHPLTKMRLGVFRLSGKPLNARMYREQLRTSSSSPGVIQLNDNITATFSSGSYFVDEVEIPLNPLWIVFWHSWWHSTKRDWSTVLFKQQDLLLTILFRSVGTLTSVLISWLKIHARYLQSKAKFAKIWFHLGCSRGVDILYWKKWQI